MIERNSSSSFTGRLYDVIFLSDDPAGKTFDVALILVIAASVAAMMAESVAPIRQEWGRQLRVVEWVFTALFVVEYALRLICVKAPGSYAASFFGVIDLVAILPSFLGLFLPFVQSFLIIRALRILRVFRVLKLGSLQGQASMLMSALRASRAKISVFLSAVLVLVLIIGSMMYMIEGEANGFTSIPLSVYWAVVTMTTVGYGDVAPQTAAGQALAAVIMILGYGIIAVPTGIVTAEVVHKRRSATAGCSNCGLVDHAEDAKFCRRCGNPL